jgi:hypothetical protein
MLASLPYNWLTANRLFCRTWSDSLATFSLRAQFFDARFWFLLFGMNALVSVYHWFFSALRRIKTAASRRENGGKTLRLIILFSKIADY